MFLKRCFAILVGSLILILYAHFKLWCFNNGKVKHLIFELRGDRGNLLKIKTMKGTTKLCFLSGRNTKTGISPPPLISAWWLMQLGQNLKMTIFKKVHFWVKKWQKLFPFQGPSYLAYKTLNLKKKLYIYSHNSIVSFQ